MCIRTIKIAEELQLQNRLFDLNHFGKLSILRLKSFVVGLEKLKDIGLLKSQCKFVKQ